MHEMILHSNILKLLPVEELTIFEMLTFTF